ncbi:MAG: hypothetical protein IPK52_17850 [Chloroflexi bacterium]|nr:hypothetical protein [Chloroflexota bacterium]
MTDVAELKSRLIALKSTYAATRQVAHRAVLRWEFADAPYVDIRPYYFELNGHRRGQRVTDPRVLPSYFRCGFDSAGRMTVESYYVKDVLVVELFWRFAPEFAEGVIFYRERPTEIIQAHFDGKHLLTYHHYDSRHSGKYAYETYAYDAGRLSRITRRIDSHNSAAEYDYILHYAPDAVLDRITLRPNTGALRFGGIPVIYQRREVLADPPESGAEFSRELVSAITAALAAAAIAEPVCALVLNYSSDLFCPPLVYVMTASHRRERVASGEAGLEALWTPDESPLEIDVPDAVCAMFENLPPDEAIELLDAAARELNAADWDGTLSVTPDFVAFALDFENDSAIERIFAAAPAAKIAILRASGWLL